VMTRSALVQLHAEQWGNSWGCFVWALADFKALRRHFRRFLMVEDERAKRMYFRFYDPRVLRVFLPTCTTAEALEFFGPIKYFVMEASDPAVALMVSTRAGELLRTDSVVL